MTEHTCKSGSPCLHKHLVILIFFYFLGFKIIFRNECFFILKFHDSIEASVLNNIIKI